MAFIDVLKKQRQSGTGLLSSIGSAAAKSTLQNIDPRNYLFKSGSVLNALFPKVKGYSADTKENVIKRQQIVPPAMDNTLVIERLNVIGKNTMVMPLMMRDLNIIRQGIIKLVSLAGGTQRDKADKFFQTAKEREALYESQFGKNQALSPTKVGEVASEGNKSKLGLFAALLPLMYGIGKYFTSPEFRQAVNGMVEKILKGIFGDDYKEKLKNVLLDVAKNVAIGLGVLGGALVVFKLAVLAITKTLEMAALRIAAAFGMPAAGGKSPKGGKVPKGGVPGKGKIGLFGKVLGALGLGGAAAAAYDYFDDEGDSGTTEAPGVPGSITGETTTSSANGVSPVVGAIAATGAAYAAKSFIQPKLDAKVEKVNPKTNFNEKAGRFTQNGKFVKAEQQKLGETLKKMQEWFSKTSKKKGFYSLIYRKVLSRFGISVALKLSAFIGGLIAAPFSAGISTLISIATAALNIYMIYELYDWLFGDENAAETIDKELDVANGVQGVTDASPVPAEATAPAEKTNTPTPATSGVSLEQIGQAESGRMGYDAANRGKAGDMPNGLPGLSTKTVGEVMKMQANKELFAAGKYQIIPATLKGLVNQGVVKETDIFNKETQDKLAQSLYNTAIAKAGDDPVKQQFELSKVWAAIANPYTGASYYAGVGNNKATIGTTVAQMPPASGKVPGTTIAGSSIQLSDLMRVVTAAAPVVINAPTTNMQSAPQTPMNMGGIPSVVDEEFMRILVSRVTG